MKIFLAYSDFQTDVDLYKELNKHLNLPGFKSLGSITDKDTALKMKIDLNDIKKLISTHDVIIPLLSVDFLNDEKSMEILAESRSNNKRVLPILVRDCMYDNVEELSPYLSQLIPENNSLLGLYDNNNDRSKIFTSIAEKIQDFVLGKFSELSLDSGRPFMVLGLSSFIIGIGLAIYAYKATNHIILMGLILGLFMTITIVSYSRYNLLNNKSKK
jgi:hypothetical protein